MAITRREFIKGGLGIASAATVASAPFHPLITYSAGLSLTPDVMVTSGDSPAKNVRKVIEALGGIEKFVKPGDRVFLKPNSISPMGPEYAVNTNPDVVAEVARLCKKAGASKILALAHDDPGSLVANGIGDAINAHDGVLGTADNIEMYQQVNIPMGMILRETAVIKEFLEYDVFINLPVAKHHGGAQLTLGMKNYMGLNWDRQIMHRTDLDQTIADLVTVRRPDLTIVDATRMLLNNGPSGPGTVREVKSVVASTDIVAVDAYTATLFKHEPREIRHIRYAAEMGLGEMEVKKMNIVKLTS